jgi:hypothetical protein
MIERRRLHINGKRFTRSDLLGTGTLFLGEAEVARREKRRHRVEFTLRCSDGTTYSGEDLSHFSEGAEVDLKPPRSVEFEFTDYELERRMDLSLTHGSGYHDGFNIRGADRDWVQGLFTRLQERVNAAAPSTSWFIRHPSVTYHLLALGFGSVFQLAIAEAVKLGIASGLIIPARVEPQDRAVVVLVLEAPAILLLVTWGLRWLLGNIAAPWVRDWILRAWPDIDLDVGHEHAKLEKMRRDRIKVFLTAVVVPLLVALVYDIVKHFL